MLFNSNTKGNCSSTEKKRYLFIIGAMKAATTTLYNCLCDTNQFAVPSRKELNYFSKQNLFSLGDEYYESLFEGGDERIRIDASTTYTRFPGYSAPVYERIREFLVNTGAEAKFIYVIRDPIERIKSQINFMYNRGYITATQITDEEWFNKHVVSPSLYFEQLSRFSECFERRDLLILGYTDVTSAQSIIVDRVGEFLGLELHSFNRVKSIHSNSFDDLVHRGRLVSRLRRHPWIRSMPSGLKQLFKDLPLLKSNAIKPVIPSEFIRRAELAISQDIQKLVSEFETPSFPFSEIVNYYDAQ